VIKNWNRAKKQLAALGVGVYKLPAACCFTCTDKSSIPDNEPALYYMPRDFSGARGGRLFHQKIGNTPEMAASVMFALSSSGLAYDWNGTTAKALWVKAAN
jgi:hypothetical protein